MYHINVSYLNLIVSLTFYIVLFNVSLRIISHDQYATKLVSYRYNCFTVNNFLRLQFS